MKKLFITLLCFFSLLNVNASEIRKVNNKVYEKQDLMYVCNGNTYKMYDYIDNKIILSDNEELNFYSYNEIDGCKKLSVNEKLKLDSKLISEFSSSEDDEYMIITTYDRYKSLSEGYTLNNEEYNKDTIYYTYIDDAYNEINTEDVDKEKLNEYYVFKYFKKLSSNEINEDNIYYVLDDNGIYTIFNDEINDDNIFNIYEEVSKDNVKLNKKNYKLSYKNYNDFIDKHNDVSVDNISYEIINETLYFIINEYDEDDNFVSVKYYDINNKELFSSFDVKYVNYYDGYYIVNLFLENKYMLYDEELNFIFDFEFDNDIDLYSSIVDYNKMYFNFMDVDGNFVTYYINSYYDADYTKYFVYLGITLSLLVCICLFLKYNKK